MRTQIVATLTFMCVGGCAAETQDWDPWDGGTSCERYACNEKVPVNDAGHCEGTPGDADDCEGYCHIRPPVGIEWDHNPPHSGNHWSTAVPWSEYGLPVYSDPARREMWVQNLENGGIVLLYRCADAIEGLDAGPDSGAHGCEGYRIFRTVLWERLAPAFNQRVLLTSDSLLPLPDGGTEAYAAVAWTWVWRFGEADITENTADDVRCFIDLHEGNGRVDMRRDAGPDANP